MMIPWLVVLVPLSVVLFSFSKRRRKRRKNEPPLICGWIPWIGCGLAFRRNALKFLRGLQMKYGSIFTIAMGGKCFTIITDARDYPAIAKISNKLDFKKAVGDVSGRAFHLSNQLDLPSARTTFEKYLQGPGLLDLDQVLRRVLRETVSSKNVIDRTEISLLQLCYEVLFPSALRTLFDTKNHCDNATLANMIQDFRHFDDMFVKIALGTISSNMDASKRLCTVLKNLSDAGAGHDMMERRHQLLREKSYHSRIEHEALSILWASLSNTVNTLFWCLHFILQESAAMHEILNEIRATRLKRKASAVDDDFTVEELAGMRFLDALMKETMRLTASSMSARKILEDVELYAPSQKRIVRLRKNDILLTPYQMTHYDADIYEDPHKFRHDRFLNGGEAKAFFKKGTRLHGHLKPFGDGASLCPGRHWAQLMAKRAFIMILENFDIHFTNETKTSQPTNDRFGFGILHPDVDEKVSIRVSSTAKLKLHPCDSRY